MSEDVVSKDLCKEKHDAIKEKFETQDRRLNDHSGRIKSVEQAVIVLTEMVKTQSKRDVFDKILIISVFIMALVVSGIVLGPDIIGKMLNSMK